MITYMLVNIKILRKLYLFLKNEHLLIHGKNLHKVICDGYLLTQTITQTKPLKYLKKEQNTTRLCHFFM